MSLPRWIPALLLTGAAISAAAPAPSRAAVVVLVNRGTRIVDFTLQNQGEAPASKSLRPREQLSWSTPGSATLRFGEGASAKQYQLDPNSAYYFGNVGAKIDLQQIGIGAAKRPTLNPALEVRKHAAPVLTIPVKVLVDDEEVQNEATWKERIRARLAAASEIFEPTARLRFEIVATERWDSDDATTDFTQSLTEFEAETTPEPGWIAIGFTSQYNQPQGATKLGGTRGPFHRHLLMREWPQHVSERERLEVLVHELGHVLGCAHSPEQDSVMRPVLGDRVARLKDFIIGFDPLNTIAMWLIAEEMRLGRVHHMAGLSLTTRGELAEIYDALAKGLPKDPAAPVYLKMAMPEAGALAALSGPQSVDRQSVKLIYDAIWLAAERNALLPPPESGTGQQGVTRLTGDALTDYYFREAASAAQLAAPDEAASAFLVALALALVDPGALQQIPPLAAVYRDAGGPERESQRAETIGQPTIRGRSDWTQHFVLSGALVVVLGPQMSEAAGLAKELTDAREGGSGFSLADYAADLSGIVFAQRMRATPKLLGLVDQKVTVNGLMPDPAGFEEGLTRADFLARYGGGGDPRFQNRRMELMRAIAQLKPYERWNRAFAPKDAGRGLPAPIDR